MAKARRKKRPPPASSRGIIRREVPTPELLVIEDLGLEFPDVVGKFVKLAPRLRPSQRMEWEGAQAAKVLREAGALGVTIAPVLIPEVTRSKAKTTGKRLDPRAHVAAWLAETHLDDKDRAEVSDMVESFMSEEGL